MPATYDVELTGREACGEDVTTMRFTRPPGYDFRPGQWFRLTLETSQGDLTETFSHVSAPGDPYLELTTRLSGSAFKQALASLALGSGAHIAGPGGRLSVPDDVATIAFLVGGVGITPVRSILRDAAQRGRRFDDALLLYGNRDESCVPFRAELTDLSETGVRTVLCFERPTPSWTGESGFITAEMVHRHLAADDGRPFLVAGPPVMVAAMERVLDDLAVAPERRIVERFGAAVHLAE